MPDSLRDKLLKAGLAASKSADEPEPEAPEPKSPDAPVFGPKLVVRYSRKGHGGKVVTTVQGVQAGHQTLVDALKRELGTGGRVDGDLIALHGEQVERVSRWLESQGARKVVRG